MTKSDKINFNIIEPNSKSEWDDYYRIRYEVLRKPWNQNKQSTRDEFEDKSIHLLVLDENNKAIATGRLQLNSESEGQIRSMAVLKEYQNKGIGKALIDKLEDNARKRGLKTMLLDAREPALNFYVQNNYIVIEDSYLLFGVIKHFRMKKEL